MDNNELITMLARLETKMDNIIEDYRELKEDVKALKSIKPSVSELDIRLKIIEDKYSFLSKSVLGAVIVIVINALISILK